jgi:predicted nuclease of restriction endonuclease-like (RecB) superfamily
MDKDYFAILEGLKEKIRNAKQKIVLTVNTELLNIYWEIGYAILKQQKEEGWGTKVVDRLIADLKIEFPDMKGLSSRNVLYMRAFAEAWPTFVQQPAAKLQSSDNHIDIIVQQVAAQLPWGHHQVIIDKLKTSDERTFYVQKAAENGWSRSMLLLNINSQLYSRQGQAITNFDNTLPPLQSDLAREALKTMPNWQKYL